MLHVGVLFVLYIYELDLCWMFCYTHTRIWSLCRCFWGRSGMADVVTGKASSSGLALYPCYLLRGFVFDWPYAV